VTMAQAALGCEIVAQTLTGEEDLRIPEGTQTGTIFRLKGKGFPAKSGRGDLLATVRIVLPEQTDAELEELMKKWQGDKPYDPRKDM